MSHYYHLITAVMCCVGFISCKPSVPDDYIQPSEMEDILFDYHITQAAADRISDNSISKFKRNEYYHAVLKKYGITKAEFDSSLVYYYTHADLMADIYTRLSERMNNEAMSVGASVGEINKYSALGAEGDTANIWKNTTTLVLMADPPYNRMDFTVDVDSTFKQGDSFIFNFISDFVYQSGTKDAVVFISLKYSNDSISSHVNHVSSSGLSQLRIPAAADTKITEMKGFIYLNRGQDDSRTLKLMFVDRIQLIRFHKQPDKKEEDSKEKPDSIGIRTQKITINERVTPENSGKFRRME